MSFSALLRLMNCTVQYSTLLHCDVLSSSEFRTMGHPPLRENLQAPVKALKGLGGRCSVLLCTSLY